MINIYLKNIKSFQQLFIPVHCCFVTRLCYIMENNGVKVLHQTKLYYDMSLQGVGDYVVPQIPFSLFVIAIISLGK